MKKAFTILFLVFAGSCIGQIDSTASESDTIADINSDTISFHYPYYGPRVPEFIGIVGGYEGFSHNCWEAGLVLNFGEIYSELSTGMLVGIILTYKRSFSGRLNTIEGEVGLYTPLTIGLGINENFYEGTQTFGFRPFLGTNLWHFQVIAGYNFYSKKRADIAELHHFTVKIRYVLPIVRMFRNETPNPGNNY